MQMCPKCSWNNFDTACFCANCGEPLRGLLLGQGEVLQGRYRVLKVLGCGGMGAVYYAEDLRLNNRPVAVKENFDPSPEAAQQFRVEAEILATLRHPNLPQVFDYFTEPRTGKQYLVMDYIAGEDLEGIVEKGGPLDERTALRIMQQVFDAVEYLHRQNPPIIHRDIKPSNIKVQPDGTAILVDFGIAKRYFPGKETVGAAAAVTPGYSPPEQYGQGITDQRSDIYALGATLYFALTGQVPPEAIERVTHGDRLVPPSRINPRISPHVERAILKAMAIRPEDRFFSVSEFKQALLTPTVSRPAPSYQPPPSPPQPSPQPPRPPLAAGGTHSLALRADGTVWAWGWNDQGQLGDGTDTDRHTPVRVRGLTDVVAVAAGRAHSLALRADGTVWAWGSNEDGELGDGTDTDRHTPVKVPGLSDVVAVAARDWHSLALRADGTVWAWGNNRFGQLGDGTDTDRHTPVKVPGLTDVVAVAAGEYHSLALRADGTVWAWGRNGYGQLGDGTTTHRHTPVKVQLPQPSPQPQPRFKTALVRLAAFAIVSMLVYMLYHRVDWGKVDWGLWVARLLGLSFVLGAILAASIWLAKWAIVVVTVILLAVFEILKWIFGILGINFKSEFEDKFVGCLVVVLFVLLIAVFMLLLTVLAWPLLEAVYNVK